MLITPSTLNPMSIFPLFVDFDGTVHPEFCTEAQLFMDLPRLEVVVRSFQDVRIIISSSWRLHRTLDEMTARYRDRWVALDDMAHLWEPLDRRIIVCADGFGAEEESRLRNRLEGFGVG